MKSDLKTRTPQNLADVYSSKELHVKERYQRGPVWKLPQKQGLIDSPLRDHQVPFFYVHLESRMNEYAREVEKTAWIVDGQQRLAAIVDYRKNIFSNPKRFFDLFPSRSRHVAVDHGDRYVDGFAGAGNFLPGLP